VARRCDVLILGAGVVGLSTGIALLESNSDLKVIIAEKESRIGFHASGRNSGVLHAGFYYSPDSLKAKFCREGNFELRKLAKKYSIPLRETGKIVVTRNSGELGFLKNLYERGVANGVDLEILEATKLAKFEPLAVTYEKFLWSPTTAVSDPVAIITAMYQEFILLGGQIEFNKRISLAVIGNEVRDSSNHYEARYIINAAGAQSDRVARSIGVGEDFAMLPFMGTYRATDEKNLPLQRLVYPVPHEINPFLGVHFTLTIDHKVKVGPTAIPIVGREQYSLTKGWSASDIGQSIKGISSLIFGESHDFGEILRSEWSKIIHSRMIRESTELVPTAGAIKDWRKRPPGIRAQLIELSTGKMVQDFITTSHLNSMHVLNAVSPGWTSSLPFGRFVARNVLNTL
jgi:L-2-hydroxyglutarate oxidase